MRDATNCLNCGAPLKYSQSSYQSTCNCEYCKTEYHIDSLGRVEEYKVKLFIDGKIHEFYLSDLTLNKIFSPDTGRNMRGQLVSNLIVEKMKVTLIEL